jgi:hypothetical protein
LVKGKGKAIREIMSGKLESIFRISGNTGSNGKNVNTFAEFTESADSLHFLRREVCSRRETGACFHDMDLSMQEFVPAVRTSFHLAEEVLCSGHV